MRGIFSILLFSSFGAVLGQNNPLSSTGYSTEAPVGYWLELETSVAHDGGALDGQTTYRVYLNTLNETDYLSACSGDDANPMFILGEWYNSPFNAGWNASGINPLFLPSFPELAFDSFLDIGGFDSNSSVGPGLAIGEFDFSQEFTGNTSLGSSFVIDDATGGAWFIPFPGLDQAETHPGFAGPDKRVLVAQLTSAGNIDGQIQVQVFIEGDQENEYRAVLPFCPSGTCGGCTDEAALNYDTEALYDDGSCIEPVAGCTASEACNYDPNAVLDDGTCDFSSCLSFGCTDMNACNYDPDAVFNDGSCTYASFPYDCNDECVNDDDSDGICNEFEVAGCTDVNACNFAPDATDEAGNCAYPEEYYDCDGNCVIDIDGDGVCDDIDSCVGALDACGICNGPGAVYECGCAEIPTGSCDCNGGNDTNFNSICDSLEEAGCTYPDAFNYSLLATMDDGSCYFSCFGDLNGDGIIQMNDLLDLLGVYANSCSCADDDLDNICDLLDECVGAIDQCGVCNGDGTTCLGCLDSDACNFNPEATILGDCEYAITNYNCEGTCIVEDALGICGGDCAEDADNDGLCDDVDDCVGEFDALGICGGDCPLDGNSDGICDTEQPEGCTYPAACNYNPYATIEDGSCDFFGCVVPGCTDPSACDYDPEATNEDGSCSYPGCIDPVACNFDGDAGCDDGSCASPGCTDPSACNFDDLAGCEDGSCDIPGCLDETACNYDATAACDGGSCTYPGCIDVEAVNYDDTAACDDGSCLYSGCTYEFACNYNPEASIDDASCEFGTCPGCTDPTACNFNPTVSENDGSCIFGFDGSCDNQLFDQINVSLSNVDPSIDNGVNIFVFDGPSGPMTLTTPELSISAGDSIGFTLIAGGYQLDNDFLEAPESGDGMSLQYSIENGPWADFNFPGLGSVNSGVFQSSEAYTNWENDFVQFVPWPQGSSDSVRLRWYSNPSLPTADNWALKNFGVSFND